MKNGLVINTNWTHRCIERGKFVKYSQMTFLNDKLESVTDSLPYDISTE